MFEQRRLHPVAAVISFLKMLKELIVPVLFLLFVGPGGNDPFQKYYYLGLLALLVILLAAGIVSWLRYTYRVEGNELRIEYGIFVRKKRYIPLERIQSIDFSRGILQRMFGLVKVQVETAGGGAQAEAVLTAVKMEEAEELKIALKPQPLDMPEGEEESAEEQTEVTYRLTTSDLLIAASTSGGIGVILSALAALASQFDELIPEDMFVEAFEWVVGLGVLVIVGAVLVGAVIAWLLSIAGTIIRYGNFTVTRKGDDIIISRGLIEKRQVTIPVRRIQAVRMSESVLRQPFGFATLFIESAGGASSKEEDFSTTLYPILRRRDTEAFLEKMLPEYSLSSIYTGPPARALRRYLFRAAVPAVIPAAAAAVWLYPWGMIGLLLIPAAGFIGYLRWKDAGWHIDSGFLFLRYRQFGRTTVALPKKRVQSLQVSQHLFQRRQGLASISSAVVSSFAGKDFTVKDLREEDVLDMFEWYSHERPDFIEKDRGLLSNPLLDEPE